MLRPGEGQLSLAGHEEVAQEPGDWFVWVETVSPGVLEPQNHRGLTAPLLGRWRLAFPVGFSQCPPECLDRPLPLQGDFSCGH